MQRRTEEEREIVRAMRADLWPALEAGKLTLPIDKTFPLGQVAEALAMMKANRHFGKIVLTMSGVRGFTSPPARGRRTSRGRLR